MKKIVSGLCGLLMAVSLLAGCAEQPAALEGTWLSGDGSTLTLADGTFTLTDAMGQSLLAQDSLTYEHRGDFLYLDLNGTEVKAFEVDLDGSELTLTYTIELQADMQTTAGESILLTRSQD